MDIQFFGANCIALNHRGLRLVVDDILSEFGGKSVAKSGDVLLFTSQHPAPKVEARLVIDQPGEYEVANTSIVGMPARSHTEETDDKSTTMYKVAVNDTTLLFTGNIHPGVADQLEDIGEIDVLFVPVGGHGYTLDVVGALKLIKEIEPKLVIPTHYDDGQLKYPIPAASLDEALKGLGMEPTEKVAKLKLKPNELSDLTQLVVLEKTS